VAEVPEISCVIPVYNDRQRLPRAVESVLSQGPQVQAVLVDDCSNDGSRELTLELARQEARIIAFPLPENRGQAFARNIGVTVADADVVTFLDQDDEHVSGWYGHALGLLYAHPDLAAVKGDLELVDLPTDLSVVRGDLRWQAMAFSPMWNVVLRKPVYQALGGFPVNAAYRTREGVEDVTLMLALTRNFKVAMREHVAVRHYVNPNGATAFFLRRSRIADGRIEFSEATQGEANGALQRADQEFQARVAANLGALRASMPAPGAPRVGWLARALGRLRGGH
jgi:glycosyltransferase involved in cell wall biosynthesis